MPHIGSGSLLDVVLISIKYYIYIYIYIIKKTFTRFGKLYPGKKV